MYFDTHAHYNDTQFDEDREHLLSTLKENNVGYVVNIGTDINTSLESIRLAEKYENVYATVGIHPHYAKDIKDSDFLELENMLNNKKVVGLGEMGLDYHYDYSPRDIQKQIFQKQLKICENVTKPVIIHSREACQDVFDIIKNSNVRKGVIHAFSGSYELAKEYVKLGFSIGVGGVVTFKNAKKLVEVVSKIPIEHILIETDAPYLTPVPFRGTRNNSKYLKEVVSKIAEIKGVSEKEIEEKTFLNAKEFFNI